jgi:hypothetical protein
VKTLCVRNVIDYSNDAEFTQTRHGPLALCDLSGAPEVRINRPHVSGQFVLLRVKSAVRREHL